MADRKDTRGSAVFCFEKEALFLSYHDTKAGVAKTKKPSTFGINMEESSAASDSDDLKNPRKKRHKRHTKDSFDTIPASLSKWTETDLQTIGVTYAAAGHDEPHVFLDKVKSACKLSEVSDVAKTIISYLHEALDFEFKMDEYGEFQEDEEHKFGKVRDQLEMAYQNVRNLRPALETKGTLPKEKMAECSDIARLQLLLSQFFIEQLQNFIEYQDSFQRIQEQFYTDTFKHFGLMCGLRGESGESIVRTIEVGKETVSSFPDIRFQRSWHLGQRPGKETILCVSVAEMKKPHKGASEVTMRKTRVALGDATASAYSEFRVKNYLNDRELGQHGGELLAEWKYTVLNPWVVGMFVCGFKVILTSLEMKKLDLFSLNSSARLHESRVIEYTKPLDILQRKDRKILYEIFFRLAESRVAK